MKLKCVFVAMSLVNSRTRLTGTRAMRAIVRGLAAGTVGLAVVVGHAAVGSAAPPDLTAYDRCVCTCYSKDASKDLESRDVRHCQLNGRDCTFTRNGVKYKGKLDNCSLCKRGGACTPIVAVPQTPKVVPKAPVGGATPETAPAPRIPGGVGGGTVGQ